MTALFTSVPFRPYVQGQPAVNDHGFRSITGIILAEESSMKIVGANAYGYKKYSDGAVAGFWATVEARNSAANPREYMRGNVFVNCSQGRADEIVGWLDAQFAVNPEAHIRISPTAEPKHRMRLVRLEEWRGEYRFSLAAGIAREADENGNFASGVRFFLMEEKDETEAREAREAAKAIVTEATKKPAKVAKKPAAKVAKTPKVVQTVMEIGI